MLPIKFNRAYAMACAIPRAKNKRLLILAWCKEVQKVISI